MRYAQREATEDTGKEHASNYSYLTGDGGPPDLCDQGAGGFTTDEYCVGPLTGPYRLGRKSAVTVLADHPLKFCQRRVLLGQDNYQWNL